MIFKLKTWTYVAIALLVTNILTLIFSTLITQAKYKTENKALREELAYTRQQNEKTLGIVVKLAEIEKYKIENRFEGKIKPTQASQLIISLDNQIKAQPDTVLHNKDPVQNVTPKLTIWKKIQKLFN